ncbi:MAG TPA: hypothetical protein VMD07_03740 [Candidatus Acidoferrales bacterium]|nr:hypothetical protein [Candidatus Acidoferrales bacterium]
MRIHIIRLFAAALLLAAVFCAPTVSSARVGSAWVEGSLVHISTTNIKIIDDKTGKELSFLLVPHFDQIFSADGKTTIQMSALHRNELVKVYYDQKFLGSRHADRIEVLNRHQMMIKGQKG